MSNVFFTNDSLPFDWYKMSQSLARRRSVLSLLVASNLRTKYYFHFIFHVAWTNRYAPACDRVSRPFELWMEWNREGAEKDQPISQQ